MSGNDPRQNRLHRSEAWIIGLSNDRKQLKPQIVVGMIDELANRARGKIRHGHGCRGGAALELRRDARIQRRQDAGRDIGSIKLGDKFPEHGARSCKPTPLCGRIRRAGRDVFIGREESPSHRDRRPEYRPVSRTWASPVGRKYRSGGFIALTSRRRGALAGMMAAGAIHDRDSRYGANFDRRVRGLGIRQVRTPFRSPEPMPSLERWVRSVRSECLDHLIVFNEANLRRVLSAYVAYYNRWRLHRSLGQAVPCGEARPFPRQACRKIAAEPVLGGLHHIYRATA